MKTILQTLPWTAALLYAAVLVFLPLKNDLGPGYLYWILLAGPVLFVPWGISLLSAERPLDRLFTARLLPFAGLALAAAYALPPGLFAAGLATAWLAVTVYLTGWVWRRVQLPGAARTAVIFLNVAAAWALADRLGWRPLGFDPLIVLLTAIHFHYAGFALAVLTARLPIGRFHHYLTLGLWLGVGAVAFGITTTQLGGPAWLETTAATLMVSVGWGIALAQGRDALRKRGMARAALLLGALFLFAGMTLALLYGWRFTHRWQWLTIPWMYATHGVLNSVGFALVSFLGRSFDKVGNRNGEVGKLPTSDLRFPTSPPVLRHPSLV